MPPRTTARAGFTLIELLIGIGIIGILASIIIVAINPLTQLEFSQNAKRKSYVREQENATLQYIIDEGDDPATGIPSGLENAKSICRPGVTDPDCINVDTLVPVYLAEIPVDIAETSAVVTGYAIYKYNGLIITICSNHLPLTDARHCASAGSSGEGGSSSSDSSDGESSSSSAAASSSSESASSESSSEMSASSSSESLSSDMSSEAFASEASLESSSEASSSDTSSDSSLGPSSVSTSVGFE